ncbi:small acid-soluble spore protein SspI [Paenibacillus pasadenensis]|uniref:small acid-soluble spore protein SspI n=1 Tax=Paenibacillus pasadenensis TaxID=217090 RepID=UPI00203CC314|nr:small acid-soluble spore protein SspI [Paenibacillus pasadenensis]MCM3749721.1 small acid-soluble spore protein SspI [Paenibacillus pasadenensis]
MNSFNLRQAIAQIVQDKSREELDEIIRESIDSDEKALPGLGVLFEMIWKDSAAEEQQSLVSKLHGHLQNA